MEYKLNKVDMDIRQKVNDATKEGKVHSKENFLQVSKDAKKRNHNDKGFNKEKFEKYNKKRKLIVKAVKVKDIEINGYLDKEEEKVTTIGMFLDARK